MRVISVGAGYDHPARGELVTLNATVHRFARGFRMARHQVWSFHNPRLSIAQSGIRAVISHSLTGAGGPALLRSRVAAWSRGATGGQGVAIPSVGVCAGESTMTAFGAVLKQIDEKKITNANQASAAYVAARSSLAGTSGPAVPAALPAAGGAGTMVSGLGRDCLDLVAQYLLAWVFDEQARENQVESEFNSSPCDPGWLTALKAWLVFYWDGRAPIYKPPTAATVPIALPPAASADGSLRVGILGDWGTGEPEAIAVLDQLMRLQPDLIVHLGDIYYAGTIDECRTNFLAPIHAARAKYGRNIPVYTIPGNHDYYSGGAGFYGMIPLLNENVPNATVQEFSFFCLRNDQWQLECMDTGYNDHDLKLVPDDITHLAQPEADWHQEQMLAAGGAQHHLDVTPPAFFVFCHDRAGRDEFSEPVLDEEPARLASGRRFEAHGLAVGSRALAGGLCSAGERRHGPSNSGALCGQRSLSGVQQHRRLYEEPEVVDSAASGAGLPERICSDG